ncbi:MAG: IPTL-CTERM sorting domain-containing protein [Acidobacteriota bacterium]
MMLGVRSFRPAEARRRLRFSALTAALFAVASLAFVPLAGAAEYTALVDLDDDATTGCSVATADGVFEGVELRLVTTVPDDMAEVVSVESQECVDPTADLFGPLTPVPAATPPWPIGLGLGVGGADVVETVLPLGSACSAIRFGFTSLAGSGAEDALLTDAGEPIRVVCGTVLDIPTLSDVALWVLALALAVAAGWILRRQRGAVATWIVVALSFSAISLGVLAGAGILLDGDPSDWISPEVSALDPTADAGAAADFAAAFVAVDEDLSTIFLRFDVLRGIEPPTITPIADQTIDEDTSGGPLGFTIDDPDTPIGALTLEATSDNQALVPDANVVLGGAGANRTVTVTPADDANGGPVTITIAVSDGITTTIETFGVTVTPVDDAPTITAIADQTIAEDAAVGPLAFLVDDPDTALPLLVTAVSDDQALIPDANLTIAGTQPNLTIEAVPTADASGGPVMITVTVDDGTTAVSEAFTVTVTPVDDPPTITAIADQTIAEDATVGPLAFLVDDPDTALPLLVTAASDDQALIPDANLTIAGTQPNLTIEAVPTTDASGGPVTITVTVDDGTTVVSETFTVTVTAEDDPPTITPIADQTLDEDTTVGPLAFTIADVDSTITCGADVTATSADQALIPNGNLTIGGAGTSCTLTVAPTADANGGPVTITVTVDDGTTAVPETFAVTVTSVNDPPTHTSPGGLASFVEDGPAAVLDAGIVLDDPDDTQLQSATLTLSPRPDGAAESLAANVGGTSILAAYSAATGVLTLTGPDTIANFQAVLRSVTYENTSNSPTADANAGTGDRTVTCVVSDGVDPSAPTQVSVNVTSVNDPPTATSPITYTALGNTLLRVDGADADNHDFVLPGRVASTVDLLDAFAKAAPADVDSSPTALGFQTGQFTTTGAPGDGVLEIDDDGDFIYTPPTGFVGTDTVVVPIADGDGGAVPVTFEITVATRIWYIEDTTGPKNPAAGDTGRSTNAFQTLAAASAAAGAGDVLFVFETDAPLDESISLQSGQRLYGQSIEDDAEFATLLPGLLLEEIADTNARPEIHPTSGAAVVVNAGGASLANVEVRHVDLESGDDDAIQVTTAGTNVASLLIDESVVGAASQRGVDADFGHTTGTATLEIRDSSVSATGDAIDVEKTAVGDVELSVFDSTGLTSTGGRGLRVEDSGGGSGSLFVTGLRDNTVSGATAGDGAVFGAVVFDADPSTGAFEQVAAEDLSIGSSGNGVGGAGVRLSNVSGDLAFDALVIEADQAGLVAAGSGVANLAAGTGFRLTTDTGTQVTANGGPALDLDPLTAAMTLDSIASSGSSTEGVRLNDVVGLVMIGGGSTITGSTGSAFLVDQDTVTAALNVSYFGSIVNTSGRLIEIDGFPAGQAVFDGPSLSDSGAGANTGSGISLVDIDGQVAISATTTTIDRPDGVAINIQGDSDGTVQLSDATITTASERAIVIEDGGSSLGGTFDFDNVDVSHAANNQVAVSVRGLVNGGAVDFDTASAVSATDGSGVSIVNNLGGTVAFNGPLDFGTAGSRLGDGTVFNFAGNSALHTTSARDVDIFATTTALSGGGLGTLDFLGPGTSTATIDTLNAQAVTLSGIRSLMNFDGVTCTHTTDCVELTNLTSGSDSRFANLQLTCTGGACFDASAAEVVRATGTANTVAATGGIGVRLVNTTIAASDMSFRSVTASGAANGIVLTNTGSAGGFNILGDGSDTLGGNSSGGTIQNTTADAVAIDRVQDVQIANLRIEAPGGDGFDIDQLLGTANRLDNVRVGNVDQANTSAVRINNAAQSFGLVVDRSTFEDCDSGQVVFLAELQGAYTSTLTIEDSEWVGHDGDALSIVPSIAGAAADTGTINHTFTRNVVRDSDLDGVSAANFGCGGRAVCNYTITDNQIRNLAKLGNFNSGLINAGYSALPVSGGSFDATIRGNQISASDANSLDHRRGINVIVEQASGTVPSFTADISNNRVDDLGNREAIYVSMRQPVSTSNVRVVNNSLGTGSIAGTTARNIGGTRDCTFFETRGGASVGMNLLLEDNTIQCDASLSDSTVDVDVRDGSRMNLTMRGNNVSSSGTSTVSLDAGPFSTSGTICLDMNAANVAADANMFNPVAVLEQTGGTFHVEGLAAGPQAAAAVEAFLDPRNNNDVSAIGGSFTNNGGANCPEPPP